MPLYQYTAINDTGQSIQGRYLAKDRNEILQMLRDKKYYPVVVKDVVEGKDLKSLDVFSRVRLKDLSVFCRQFYTMLNSGITVIKCLDILSQQTENRRLKLVVSQVYEEVQKGATLSESLKNHRDVFPEILISMVESGEMSGRLDMAMERMSVHFEKENRIRSKIKSAMIYPIILIIASVGVVTFLMVAVLPMFIEMFESSGVTLPGPTRLLLFIANGFRRFWYIIFLVITGIVYAIRRYAKTDTGKLTMDRMKLQLPVVKNVVTKVATSRFTRTLSILLSSGIPLMHAAEVTAKVVGNKIFADGIMNAREEMRKGSDLSGPVRRMGIFPPMVDSMIRIGEESGTLDDMLEKTANFYDEEVDVALQRMVSLMEPLLIIFMAVIIGFIVISIALPMFDMANTVK